MSYATLLNHRSKAIIAPPTTVAQMLVESWPRLVGVGPILADAKPNLAAIGRLRAHTGRARCKFDRIRPTSARLRPESGPRAGTLNGQGSAGPAGMVRRPEPRYDNAGPPRPRRSEVSGGPATPTSEALPDQSPESFSPPANQVARRASCRRKTCSSATEPRPPATKRARVLAALCHACRPRSWWRRPDNDTPTTEL